MSLVISSSQLRAGEVPPQSYCFSVTAALNTTWLHAAKAEFIQDVTFIKIRSSLQSCVGQCPPLGGSFLHSSGTLHPPLLLIVLEGRVPFSTSQLYQPQLWNPRFASDASLLLEGKWRDVRRTVANHKGKERDGHKWGCFTPNRPWGTEDTGLGHL